jgi:membrane fusion protein, multidrug efflux system
MHIPASILRPLGALMAIALAGCGPAARPAAAPRTPEVTVVTVHPTRVPVTLEFPGRTTAFLTAQVRARVDGIVSRRLFAEGTDVKAGAPLYEIDPTPYQAELDAAAAALQKAQASLATTSATLDRYQVLIASGAVSKQAYDNAVLARRQALADVAAATAAQHTAAIRLGYTRVVSPIGGRSGASAVTPGGYVQASAATLLTTVQQIDPIYVDLQQSSAEALALRRLAGSAAAHAPVALTLEDGKPYPLPGKLEFTGSTVDPATGTVTMRAVFANPDHILLPGMFVRAQITEGATDDAMLVPARAVGHDAQGRATALVVGRGDILAERVLQTGGLRDGSWVVTGGLHDGDRVVLEGEKHAVAGAHVNPVAAAVAVAAADGAAHAQ